MKLYIESSVVNFVYADDDPDRAKIMNKINKEQGYDNILIMTPEEVLE